MIFNDSREGYVVISVLEYLKNECRDKSYWPFRSLPHIHPNLLPVFSVTFLGLQGLLWDLYLIAGDQHRQTDLAPCVCVGHVPLPLERIHSVAYGQFFYNGFPPGVLGAMVGSHPLSLGDRRLQARASQWPCPAWHSSVAMPTRWFTLHSSPSEVSDSLVILTWAMSGSWEIFT